MILRQTLEKPINGYWDGGAKSRFDWVIDGETNADTQVQYVSISSYDANTWFNVAVGKTDKLTLSNAKRHLRSITRIPSTFEYID